jgi:beta-lactamase class A
VIEGEKKSKIPTCVKGEKVKEEFKAAVKDLSGVYGLYVLDLESGYSFGIGEDEVFEAASLINCLLLLECIWRRNRAVLIWIPNIK